MKKIAKSFLVLSCIVFLGIFIAPFAKAATPASGDGSESNPYVLADYGEYEISGTSSNNSFYFMFGLDGTVSFQATSGNIYKSSGPEMYDSFNEVTKDEVKFVRVGGSNSTFTLTVSYTAGVKYTSKDSALDLSTMTTAQEVSISQEGLKQQYETWFKVTITKPSTIEFEPFVTNAHYGFFKADGTTQALTKKNFFDLDDFNAINNDGYVSFETLEQNIFIPTNSNKTYYSTDHAIKDNKAKISFQTAGTYYIVSRIGSSKENRGFKSFVVRDYRQITGLTFSKGKKINVVEYGKGSNVTNYITGILPKDADGFPDHAIYDKSKLEITATTMGGANDKMSGVDFKASNFGPYTVSIADERGKKVDSYTITNIPNSFKDYTGTGTSDSISVRAASGNSQSAADSVRIYLKKGSKYVLSGTFKGGTATLKKLKDNTKYSIKLTNYDSKTKAESKLSKAFTVGTAPKAKPVIKSVTGIKITKNTGYLIHNAGKFNEYREKYTYYAASGKITVGKIKGTSYYEFNLYGTSCPNTMAKTSDRLRLVMGGKTAASCKKTIKLQCRAVKKYTDSFIAYGSWGKTKKVKIK